MKKRAISLLLILVMLTGLMPAAPIAEAAEAITNKEPVYLGTEAEYKTTLQTMFDENGLRKVMVAFNSANDTLYNKYGFVDKSGKFVVQPIYDEIQFYTAHDAMIYYGGDKDSWIVPKYFLGGYTQVVRDGKMGLMNTKGEEVIPCKYDYVSLPSEGVSRVLNAKPNSEWY